MGLLDCYINIFIDVLKFVQAEGESGAFRRALSHQLRQAQCSAEKAGYAQQDIEDAHFAVVVWADETILCSNRADLTAWRTSPLQIEYCATALGGMIFFERLSLRAPDDISVRLVYLFCLLLGFRGRYDGESHTTLNNVIKQLIESLPIPYQQALLTREYLFNTQQNSEAFIYSKKINVGKAEYLSHC